MNYRLDCRRTRSFGSALACAAALALLSHSHVAQAWDCTVKANQQSSNPSGECYVKPSPPPPPHKPPSGSPAGAASNATATSTATASAAQQQAQGQVQAQRQTAIGVAGDVQGGAGGTATATGNGGDSAASQELAIDARQPRAPVNTAIAGFAETTAPCWHGNGIGAQAAVAGIAIGHSSKDQDCERLTLAELMYSRQQWHAGNKIFCSIRNVLDALGTDCLAILDDHEVHPALNLPPQPALTPKEVDKVREDRKKDRGFPGGK